MADIRNSPQLDDFQRADEHPILSPWEALDPGVIAWRPNHLHSHIMVNQTGFGAPSSDDVPPLGPGTNISWSYWSQGLSRGDFELWGHRHGGEAGAAGTGWRLGIWTRSSVESGVPAGFIVLFFTAIGDTIQFRKYTDPTSFTNLDGGVTNHNFAQWLMLRKVGATLEAWTVGTPSGTWTKHGEITMDSNVDDEFFCGYGVEDPTGAGTGWSAVGGALLKRRSQIYRRVASW